MNSADHTTLQAWRS